MLSSISEDCSTADSSGPPALIQGSLWRTSWFQEKTHRRNFWTRTNSAMSALSTLEIWVDIQIWRGVSWPNLKDRQDAKISQKVKTKRHGNCLELEPLWTNSHLILNFHVFFCGSGTVCLAMERFGATVFDPFSVPPTQWPFPHSGPQSWCQIRRKCCVFFMKNDWKCQNVKMSL